MDLLNCRLPSSAIQVISERLLQLRSCIPSEFARKPRGLTEIDRWKATEFRQFLLYTGPVLLQGILSSQLLNNFLVLAAAMTMLMSDN